jgi:tocopherol O-methyltransferase
MILPDQAPTAAAIARHYDELGRFYLDIWGDHIHHGLWETGREDGAQAVRAMVDFVARLARIGSGDTVCDVGCGFGGTARILAEEYGASVTGLTLSEDQVAYGAARSNGNPRYLLQDWLDNDLPVGAFDAVVAIESWEHMHDKERFVTEAARVLKPGGRFVACAWLAGEGVEGWRVRHLLRPICREGRLPGLGEGHEYASMVKEAGLELDGWWDLADKVRRTWPICIRRLALRTLTRREYRAFLLDNRNENRVFALTAFRIWAAYAVGAMRYGVFSATKPVQ